MDRPAGFFDVPLLRYVGSKWMIADWITQFFPEHDCYVEPFAGSGAVFLRKPPSAIEVLNDLNSDLVNFYTVLRNQGPDLIQAIELTPFSRKEYLQSYQPADNPLEQARRFYIRCWMSFGASEGRRTGFRYQRNVNRGTSVTREWSRTEGLQFAAREFKSAIIESLPALEIIQRYDTPRTLFYVDPPYVKKSRSGGVGRNRYLHEMNDDDHCQLAAALQQIKGTAIVSGYASELYDKLFTGWKSFSKSTTTNCQGKAMEYIWLHPRIETLPAAYQRPQTKFMFEGLMA